LQSDFLAAGKDIQILRYAKTPAEVASILQSLVDTVISIGS
jgi:hypothetical protein